MICTLQYFWKMKFLNEEIELKEYKGNIKTNDLLNWLNFYQFNKIMFKQNQF